MSKELEEAKYRINFHKDNAELTNGTCIVNKLDLETVLNELKRLKEENKDLKQANREKADKLIEITDLYMKSVSKDKIREKIKEMQEEYNKLDKQVDEYINDSKKDLNKYYENKEKISTMQTIGWTIGKIEELLEGE